MIVRALLDCLLISTVYVAPFYLQTRRSRSHTTVILSRFLSTTLACAVSWVPLYLTLSKLQAGSEGSLTSAVLQLLGLRLRGLGAALSLPVLLTAALFLGPLTLWAWDWQQGLLTGWRGRPTIQLLRDLLMGPLTEEFAFRSCMAPLLLLQGLSVGRTILLTPVFFGLSHVHHVYEYVVHQGRPLSRALMAVAFQFGFTTVFGWFASFVFLRTGHLAAAVAVHAFCNLMGFPDFEALKTHPARGLIRAMFGVGICLFCALLGPLTRPQLYANNSPDMELDNEYLHLVQTLIKQGPV